jgi:hypothetical protein
MYLKGLPPLRDLPLELRVWIKRDLGLHCRGVEGGRQPRRPAFHRRPYRSRRSWARHCAMTICRTSTASSGTSKTPKGLISYDTDVGRLSSNNVGTSRTHPGNRTGSDSQNASFFDTLLALRTASAATDERSRRRWSSFAGIVKRQSKSDDLAPVTSQVKMVKIVIYHPAAASFTKRTAFSFPPMDSRSNCY